MTNRVIKRKFYRQEFDPTDKFFYRNDLEEYERFFKPLNYDSSLIPRRGYEPGNETNITVSYRGYSVTYLNCIEELNLTGYMSGPGSRSGCSSHGLTNICLDFIATSTTHFAQAH